MVIAIQGSQEADPVIEIDIQEILWDLLMSMPMEGRESKQDWTKGEAEL